MAITAAAAAEARWRPCQGLGLQTFRVRQVAEGYVAMGAIVAEDDAGEGYGLDVLLDLRADWTVRAAHFATTDGRELNLEHDGHGTWTSDGEALPQLDGCIDIDISATPLTNTLPVRRLKWRKGQSRELRMAYVQAPELQVFADAQRYTFLGERRFHFEAVDGDFAADISFDGHGLVADYPPLFQSA